MDIIRSNQPSARIVVAVFTVAISLGLAATLPGCGGSSKQVARQNEEQDAKQKAKAKQARKDSPDKPQAKGKEAPTAFKPLEIRRLKRDPRSVLDRLEDAKAEFRRNDDGNIRVLKLPQADPTLLAALPRLEYLEELAIQETDASLDPESVTKVLQGLNLKSLELHGRSVTSEHLAAISELEQLQLLRLSGTRVDDRLMETLPNLRNLERLELSWSRVTDAGVGKLSKSDSVTTLDLSFTEITDASLESLAQMKSLKTLILSGTSISQAASLKLREALSDTRIIGLPTDGDLPPPPPDPNEPPPGLIAT